MGTTQSFLCLLLRLTDITSYFKVLELTYLCMNLEGKEKECT